MTLMVSMPWVGEDCQLLEAALAYARHGIPVFPLFGVMRRGDAFVCECGRATDERGHKPGKHPHVQGGFHAATTDELRIRRWWATWPHANIGIATGSRSGIDVVDDDTSRKGGKSLAQHGPIPATLTVRSGSGGLHYYFGHREDVRTRQNIFPNIDICADDGYVVAPPSLHISGGHYHAEP